MVESMQFELFSPPPPINMKSLSIINKKITFSQSKQIRETKTECTKMGVLCYYHVFCLASLIWESVIFCLLFSDVYLTTTANMYTTILHMRQQSRDTYFSQSLTLCLQTRQTAWLLAEKQDKKEKEAGLVDKNNSYDSRVLLVEHQQQIE